MPGKKRVSSPVPATKLMVAIACILGVAFLLLNGLSFFTEDSGKIVSQGGEPGEPLKKCLFVASYGKGYPWQDEIESGIREVLSGRCEVKQFDMDTKRNRDPAHARQKALEAKALIESWKPDVVIASDDNVSKYLIMPYYRDADLPFVFCGVNWSGEKYGYPYTNVTGMIEVNAFEALNRQIQRIVPDGKNAVCLVADYTSSITACRRYKDLYAPLGVDVRIEVVRDMPSFKEAYIRSQDSDFIIFMTNYGLEGWDDTKVRKFLLENSRTLSIGLYDWMIPHVMLAMTNVAREQGEYAAQVALRILEGASPGEFPIVANRRWNIHTNIPLLEKAGIALPSDLRLKAERVREGSSRKRCLYVVSYHVGYPWQDGIDRGIRGVLGESCEIRRFNMDTKRNTDPDFRKQRALEAKALIDSWKPDIVIASDDNASRYLVMPYYRDADLPFVFCGINWSVEEYGCPYANATGMIEVAPILELLDQIREIVPHAKSAVCLTPDRKSDYKNCERIEKEYGKRGIDVSIARIDDMEEFERAYVKAQEKDFVYFNNFVGIREWDPERARAVISKHTRKMSAATTAWIAPYVMLTFSLVPEEQGEYAAQAALRILSGTAPSHIPIIANRKWNILVNEYLQKKAGIELPVHLLQKAVMVE